MDLFLKGRISYIKSKHHIHQMKKNRGEIFESIEVDPISGEYYITIPEQIMNELSWYEDTKIKFTIDGGEVILTEAD
jgi:hypothetical protein